MIIDFHTHAFPDDIHEKAIETLSANSGNMKPYTDGSVGSLLEKMDSYGVDKAVVLNIATNVRQMQKVNDFAAYINGDRIISFGSVHPDAPDAIEELYRIKELGLTGIKLHPDYQDFFVDDEKMFPIYEKAAELGFITAFHAGLDLGIYNPIHCPPEKLARVLPIFKGAPVVAAHFGGFELWNDVEKYLVGKDIYFDTSFCYSRMPCEQARKIVKTHGADKILLGSDIPWSPTSNEIDFIKSFKLCEKDEALILGENARKLLKL